MVGDHVVPETRDVLVDDILSVLRGDAPVDWDDGCPEERTRLGLKSTFVDGALFRFAPTVPTAGRWEAVFAACFHLPINHIDTMSIAPAALL